MERHKQPCKEAIMITGKIREKSIDKSRNQRLLAVLLVPLIALILGSAAPQVWAQEISEFEVFFEFNSTDLDLGFDIFLDADPWTNAMLTAPDGTTLFFEADTGDPTSGLREKGNTEIFTESAEPPFGPDCDIEDECREDEIEDAIADFQAFFPAGTWRIDVTFVDDSTDTAFAELSHDLAAAPRIRRPKEDRSIKKIKSIKWADQSQEGDPEIIGYEVVAEMVVLVEDDEGEEEELTYVNTATLPGSARKLTISPEFMKLAKKAKKRGELVEFKVEIIARADNLNKTIAERVLFELEDDDDDDDEEEEEEEEEGEE
jgi:hypothetical protein